MSVNINPEKLPPLNTEAAKEGAEKQQSPEASIKDATLVDLGKTVDASKNDDPKERVKRIFDGRKRRIMGNTSSKINSPDFKEEKADLTLKEASDYIVDAGGKVETKKDGKVLISVNTSKLPKAVEGEQNVGLMNLLPPMKEFTFTSYEENPDGSKGKQKYSQKMETRVVDGHMQCFYRDQKTKKDVVVDTSKLDIGHTTIETSLEFDENWSKKQAKEAIKTGLVDTSKEQFKAADEQAKLIAEAVKTPVYSAILPHRKREYVPYNEDNHDTPHSKEVEKIAVSYDESTPLRKPEELADSIETNEGFVKGIDDYKNTVILRKTAYESLKIAMNIAHRDGYKLKVTSSYRSFDEQDAHVKEHQAAGNYNPAMLAPAGRSNHHTGGAVDIHAFGPGEHEDQGKLKGIMEEAGFVPYNLKLEDWHWEYGTQRWAKAKGLPASYSKVMSLDRGSVASA